MLKRYKHEISFLVFVLILLFIWRFGPRLHFNIQEIQEKLSALPLLYAGLLYIVLYVGITFFIFFSKDFFWLMGALLFGAGLSTAFICIAEIINAFILFFLARHLGRSYVEKKLSSRYKHLDEKLGKISFFWLFIFRAAPLIPYRFLDLGAGLTSIRFRKYLMAVILGSPLKMFWIQHILSVVGKNIFTNPYALADYFLFHKSILLFSFFYIILIVMVVAKISSKD